MNRLIVRYAYPVSAAILAIFAWVIFSRASRGWDQVTILAIAAVVVWLVGTPLFLYFWPRITVSGFKRAIVKRGLSGGPIPVNTLFAEPSRASASASSGSLIGTGTDDVLYIAGWLDLKKGPLVVHVPDMVGRYYSLQFTDASKSSNFAYVGTRATGTAAGEFLVGGPGWKGTAPPGMGQIVSPTNAVLVIGRVFVADESDQPAAYALAQQIQLTPFNR